jgi:hypothetical protein
LHWRHNSTGVATVQFAPMPVLPKPLALLGLVLFVSHGQFLLL